tara:strand:- start:112 stop:324 length:213 start_codon:yes stop_codon:yes gene_type:complete
VRGALKGGKASPKTVSLIIVYTLAKALAISPLEVYKMPSSLVQDLLIVHTEMEKIKAEELDKVTKQNKLR